MKAFKVARKEIADHLNSRRFLLVFGLMLLLTAASSFEGVRSYQDQMEQFRDSQSGSSDGIRVIGSEPSKPSVTDAFSELITGYSFSLLGGILALVLSFNSISGERERNTLKLLTSYPLHRDSIINGKFLAGIATLAVVSTASFAVASAIIIGMTGATVTGAAVTRIFLLLAGSVIYMSCIYGLGTLLSTVFKESSNALTGGLLFIIFTIIIVPQFSFMIAEIAVPQEGVTKITVGGERENSKHQKRQEIRKNIIRATPSGSYGYFSQYMLGENPSKTGYTGGQETQPTVSESLKSSWGVLALLLGQTTAFFAFSYIIFMRQDIQ